MKMFALPSPLIGKEWTPWQRCRAMSRDDFAPAWCDNVRPI